MTKDKTIGIKRILQYSYTNFKQSEKITIEDKSVKNADYIHHTAKKF